MKPKSLPYIIRKHSVAYCSLVAGVPYMSVNMVHIKMYAAQMKE